MYKRLTLPQVLGIQSGLFSRLQTIYKSERCQYLKEFLKVTMKEGNDVYYIREGNGFFRISKKPDDTYIFTDEVEKIELPLDEAGINELHNLLKGDKKIQKIMKENQSIKATLQDEFDEGERKTFMGKPYIVYDIETTWTTNDLKNHELSVGYMVDSETGKYKLIDKENASKFVDYLLAFDGRVVGFYNIGFDNPVMLYNTEFTQEKLDALNAKSIDICYFVQQRLGRRIGLNKLSEALVGAKKSLESGLEGAKMYKEYLETGDTKLLDQVKKYCKNDVKMTHLVFLYLLKYKKLHDEGQEVIFTDDELFTYSQIIQEKKTNSAQDSIF